VTTIFNRLQDALDSLRAVDFLAPLALRLYLVPVFWVAGTNKLGDMPSTIAWFGNPDWGLGLPSPALMAWAAALTEAVGAVLLLIGLAVRWISIPLMVTMAVAAVTVHWHNGWAAIAETAESAQRLSAAQSLLREHGNYDWLTGSGEIVILNNGIEFAATYFVMLLALFFLGAGRYLSIDDWIARRFRAAAR
jgi:uncharacterized membrane protein YphA (DoxX/SURF4 family)